MTDVKGCSTDKVSRIGWYPWVVCGLGALFYTYEYLLRISPGVMTTQLMRAYSIGAEQLGNLIAFYYYAYAPAQLLVGVLLDKFGPRRILSIACLICALGSYFFSTDYFVLAGVGRFMVGFGSAFAFVGVLKLATIWLPPERFAMISGLTSALGTIGAMFGEVVMTEMVEKIGWQQTVFISAGVGIILAMLLLSFLHDGDESANATPEPLSFREVFRNLGKILTTPQIWVVGLIGCLLYLPTTAFAELWGNAFFESVFHFSTEEAALAISSIFLGFTVGGPLNGLFSDRLRCRRLPMIFGGLMGAGVFWLLLNNPDMPHYFVFPLMFLFGACYSVQVIVFAVGREIAPQDAAGTAVAITNCLVMLGGVVFQPVIGKLLDLHWGGQIVDFVHVYSPTAYIHVMMIVPIALLCGALLAMFLRETRGELDE